MGKTRQKAIIFCGRTEIPGYMKQVVSWLESKFRLAYLEMPDDPEQELCLDGSIRYVFVMVDLKDGDKRIITGLKQKTKQEFISFLEGPDDQLPSSFRLSLAVTTASSETSPEAFSPCLITFSEDYLGSFGRYLGALGSSIHVNQADSIFHDKQALLKDISFGASSQKYAEKLYKTMPNEG
jgi:hypothetical protein